MRLFSIVTYKAWRQSFRFRVENSSRTTLFSCFDDVKIFLQGVICSKLKIRRFASRIVTIGWECFVLSLFTARFLQLIISCDVFDASRCCQAKLLRIGSWVGWSLATKWVLLSLPSFLSRLPNTWYFLVRGGLSTWPYMVIQLNPIPSHAYWCSLLKVLVFWLTCSGWNNGRNFSGIRALTAVKISHRNR